MIKSSTGCMVWSLVGCLTKSLRHLLLLPRCLRPPRLPQRQQQPPALHLPVLEKTAMMNSSTGCMVWSWVGCLTQSLRHLLPPPHCLRPPRLSQRHLRLPVMHLLLPGMRAMMNSSTGCMVWSWEVCLTQSLRHLLLLPRCLRPPRLPQRQQQQPALHLPVLEKMSMMNSSTGCMVWSLEGCLTQSLRHLLPPPHCLRPRRLSQRHL